MAAAGTSGKTLEERLRLIEDRFAIYDLIARHPPSADTGAGEFVASVWAEDGVFDRGAEFPRPSGRAAQPAARGRKRPLPGAAQSFPSSTMIAPRRSTVLGQPFTVRPA